MLIQPFIVNERRETVLLSHRELRLASDGYGVVRYRRKLNYVTTDLQIIMEEPLPPQTGSVFLKENDTQPILKPSQGYTLDNEPEKLNLPPVKKLSIIAFDGIDEGFLALKMLRTSDLNAQDSFQTALSYRPRYDKLNSSLHFSDIKEILINALRPDHNFQSIAHRYFSYPYNNNEYLRTTRSLPNFKLSDYLDGRLSKTQVETVNKSSTNDFFLANVFFHHCIYLQSLEYNSEYDVLNYDGNIANKPSNECQRLIKRWRLATFEELFNLCAELPRRILKNGKRLSLMDPNYPEFIKNLSIFSIAPITYNISVVARLSKLHKSGIRKIGHVCHLNKT